MFESFLPLRFPEANQATLLFIGASLFSLFLLAVLMEMLRRRNNRRRLIAAEWDTFERLVQERDFSNQERELLTRIIRNRAADAPLQVVTGRREFDACIEAEMDALRAEGNEERFREVGIILREIRVRLDLDYVPFGQRIHSTRQLNVGQEIWLAPAPSGGAQWVRASVMAVDEAYLHVAIRDDKVLSAEAGRELRCHFWREDDARYELTASVAHCEGVPASMISLYHLNELRRIQARDFYRVRYNQETTVGVLSVFADEEKDLGKRRVLTRFRGRISSLSAGGLAIVTPHVVQAQTLLRVAVELPGETPFEAEINTVAVDSLAGGRYLVRGAFVNILEEKRDAIAHYVMRRQQPQYTPRETLPTPSRAEKPE